MNPGHIYWNIRNCRAVLLQRKKKNCGAVSYCTTYLDFTKCVNERFHFHTKPPFRLHWKGDEFASRFICKSYVLFIGPQVQYSRKKKNTLKMSPTQHYSYLKIILLQCFQFSAISGIQTNLKCEWMIFLFFFFSKKSSNNINHLMMLVNFNYTWFESCMLFVRSEE